MKFVVFKSRNKQWRWHLRSANGKLVANSGESYHLRRDCLHAIKLVKATDRDTTVVNKFGTIE